MAKSKVRMLAGLRSYAAQMQKASRANYQDAANYRMYFEENPSDLWARNGWICFQRMHAENAAKARKYLLCVLALQ